MMIQPTPESDRFKEHESLINAAKLSTGIKVDGNIYFYTARDERETVSFIESRQLKLVMILSGLDRVARPWNHCGEDSLAYFGRIL